ncbi:MAG TPA: endopeptidase La [Candidatus Cloacimonadota bacterium]|nr:endopeptidase La [Candidatus Cloacimonadota bacterium]HQB40638.1 endopeptidase La [Candidatus Cloacimonadota bacterium]
MNFSNQIPRTLPVIYLNNIVMFPYLMLPLVTSDERIIKIIEYSMANDKILAYFLQKDSKNASEIEVYEHGTAVRILRMLRNNDGSLSLLLQGVTRIKLEKVTQHQPFMLVEVETIAENLDSNPTILANRKITLEMLDQFVLESEEMNKDLIVGLKTIKQHGRVSDIIAGNIPIDIKIKQKILETNDLVERFTILNQEMAELVKIKKVENTIRNKLQLEMTEDQRRYYLKEQLEAIRRELGEADESSIEAEDQRKKVEDANLPPYVYEVAMEELKRLSMIPPASSEYNVVRTYLDWLINIPWTKHSEDRLDLKEIEQILTNDHFGLEQVKERIIEFIAVKKLKQEIKGPILCFTGPPGTGKTSMGKSIAKSMNREFIRISLGGIHDEAEIRGHRRTYIGAMPGRIINEIKRCKTSNPLFMLDEIDKVGKDFRGDPASALLEVLDPEQNSTFVDNYINLPFDLSDVFFITTANSLDTIPPALRDRMEVISFSSYIEEEKVQIARKYLIPKELDNNGLTKQNVQIQTCAIKELIRYYVRESGVRSLQRTIATIMRKIARKVAEGDEQKVVVTSKRVKDYLGRRKFQLELANRKPEIGIVTGLAWTSFGGEILFCETTQMPGKGNLILTGLLGEVMQESAKIALTYLKSNYKKYKINIEELEKTDLHIHLPSGAVPKDGPSAGVTLTTSIASVLLNSKVRHDIAMTGEVTLYGNVLPIGGVKEKFLAAKRANIKNILLPYANQDDYEELPSDIKEGIKVKFIKHIDDIFSEVFIKE